MKKFLVVLVLMLGTMVGSMTQAQRVNMYSTHLSINNSPWKPTKVKVTIDFDEKRTVIYSKEIQILDIIDMKIVNGNTFTLYSTTVTDTNYTVCGLDIYIYKSGTIIYKLIYGDITYKYNLKEY